MTLIERERVCVCVWVCFQRVYRSYCIWCYPSNVFTLFISTRINKVMIFAVDILPPVHVVSLDSGLETSHHAHPHTPLLLPTSQPCFWRLLFLWLGEVALTVKWLWYITTSTCTGSTCVGGNNYVKAIWLSMHFPKS